MKNILFGVLYLNLSRLLLVLSCSFIINLLNFDVIKHKAFVVVLVVAIFTPFFLWKLNKKIIRKLDIMPLKSSLSMLVSFGILNFLLIHVFPMQNVNEKMQSLIQVASWIGVFVFFCSDWFFLNLIKSRLINETKQ